jgi:biopolymer transport protein ExbD
MKPFMDVTETGSLRLPVPFFDLFMVLLICFMMFLAPTPAPSLDTRSIDIPLGRATGSVDPSRLIAVLPRRDGNSWVYELAADGRRLKPAALANLARQETKKVVLVVPATFSLQHFVEMQGELREQRIEFGLAVKEEGAR